MSESPKIFISYSWTTPEHEAWVLQLATELREQGIDAILDKWHLREGHDAHAFMEKMVSDPEISKVILICDNAYVNKANSRSGGVGTEAQIITSEIYGKQDQSKFVALVLEKDEQGKACLPIYYKTRIYIDFSDPSKYNASFEQLLRWAYDKPLYKIPEIGTKPAFLSEEDGAILLATSVVHRQAIKAIKECNRQTFAILTEYFTTFTNELHKFAIENNPQPLDEAIIKNIDAFLPYRDEVIELFLTIALHCDTEETRLAVHNFFEQLLPFLLDDWGERHPNSAHFDNFRFIIHELFLYAIAALIKYEKFDFCAYLMDSEYLHAANPRYGRVELYDYCVFRQPLRSLAIRNDRLRLERLSLRADLLSKRNNGKIITFSDIMQVDFLLYFQSIAKSEDHRYRWYPETLLYAHYYRNAFPIFMRSHKKEFFERTKKIIGVRTKAELDSLGIFLQHEMNKVRWQFEEFNALELSGFAHIATVD